MVRPKRLDEDSVALTHIRISLATKQLLDQLMEERGHKTTDELLRTLLLQAQAQPQTSPSKPSNEDILATRHRLVDRIIKSVASKYR